MGRENVKKFRDWSDDDKEVEADESDYSSDSSEEESPRKKNKMAVYESEDEEEPTVAQLLLEIKEMKKQLSFKGEKSKVKKHGASKKKRNASTSHMPSAANTKKKMKSKQTHTTSSGDSSSDSELLEDEEWSAFTLEARKQFYQQGLFPGPDETMAILDVASRLSYGNDHAWKETKKMKSKGKKVIINMRTNWKSKLIRVLYEIIPLAPKAKLGSRPYSVEDIFAKKLHVHGSYDEPTTKTTKSDYYRSPVLIGTLRALYRVSTVGTRDVVAVVHGWESFSVPVVAFTATLIECCWRDHGISFNSKGYAESYKDHHKYLSENTPQRLNEILKDLWNKSAPSPALALHPSSSSIRPRQLSPLSDFELPEQQQRISDNDDNPTTMKEAASCGSQYGETEEDNRHNMEDDDPENKDDAASATNLRPRDDTSPLRTLSKHLKPNKPVLSSSGDNAVMSKDKVTKRNQSTFTFTPTSNRVNSDESKEFDSSERDEDESLNYGSRQKKKRGERKPNADGDRKDMIKRKDKAGVKKSAKKNSKKRR